MIVQEEEKEQLIKVIDKVRKDHPQMSARVMYRLVGPRSMGRDKFEFFCFELGYKVNQRKNYHRTTNSLGVTRFPNLLIGDDFELTGVNQVWVSDITYYRINEKFYYLTFVMDLYSRKIIGYSASEDLYTVSTTIPALKMAMKERDNYYGVIFHSDGGGQYYCKEFLLLTKDCMRNSMCETVYENANAERLNGVLKNHYLYHYSPENYTSLKKMLKKAVFYYNEEKPHRALSGLSPNSYEVAIRTKKVIS
jgi:transposase InsO family protein